MTAIDPMDADWSLLREAFDALVDVPAADRAAELAKRAFPPPVHRKLQRLLRIDGEPEPLLVPGRSIELPPSPPAAAPATFALPHRLGRYELLASIGKGGMGEVFRARDTLLERDVAVKVLAASLVADTQWLQRFRREARAAGSLNHPNVVTVHDVGEHDGAHFLVTELIDGETMRRRIERGPLPLAALLDCSAQITGAVAAAHAAGIVHRDLKPENVMVRRDGIVKVLDFGLAKTAAAPLAFDGAQNTGLGVLVGTIRYMSPEQARGQPVDARSDVFALGALLHELATGEPAFHGASPLDVLVALLDRAVPPLAARRPDLPAAFTQLVDRALEKDPARRPASATELFATIDALRAGVHEAVAPEPVPAVRYARSGDVDIAYQVLGSGPIDLVFVMGWISHLEWFWREPSFARFLRSLAAFSRVVLFDKRGTGLSDRVATDRLPTLEQRIDDVRAVLDAIGSKRAVLCGVSEGGPMCALFAASFPERTQALVMIGSYARRLRTDDYPWGLTEAQCEQFCSEIQRTWGGPVGVEARAPSRAQDPAFRDWWAAYLRHGASPNAAVALTRMNAEIDVRAVLPTISVPTLVVHRTGDRCLTIEQGRYLAQNVPGASLVELPGDDHLPFVGDQHAIVTAIEQFLAKAKAPAAPNRQLATIVRAKGHHAAAADLAAWRHAVVQGPAMAQSRSLAVADDELLAVFDGPARAIRAAREVAAVAARFHAPMSIVVHTGECKRSVHGVAGAVVAESEALLERAEAGAIVVSGTARDLVAGAGFQFAAHEPAVRGGASLALWTVA